MYLKNYIIYLITRINYLLSTFPMNIYKIYFITLEIRCSIIILLLIKYYNNVEYA